VKPGGQPRRTGAFSFGCDSLRLLALGDQLAGQGKQLAAIVDGVDYPAVKAVLKRKKPDFVQIDYSLDNRGAEKTILPLAAEVRAGVLSAMRFGNGRLFRAVHGKRCRIGRGCSRIHGDSFSLKYLLSDARVTAVSPGTGDPSSLLRYARSDPN